MALQIANLPVPTPRPARGMLGAINDGLNLAQNIFKTSYYPSIIKSEIARNRNTGMPELMRAQEVYQGFVNELGPDHPVTKEALENYRLMQGEIKQKMAYQAAIAEGVNFRSLTAPMKDAIMQTQLDQGAPITAPPSLGGGAIPSNAPPAPAAGNKLYGSTLTDRDINRIQQLTNAVNTTADAGATAAQQRENYYQTKADIPKLQAKNMDQLMKGVQDASISSQGIVESLYKINNAYEKAPPLSKGAVFGTFAKFNPQMQIAIKNMRDVMLKLGVSQFRGAGGIRLASEFKAIQDALLNEKLDPEAMYAISKRTELISRQIQALSNVAQGAKSAGVKNPEDIRGLMELATEKYPIVDENGNYSPENVNRAHNMIEGLDHPLDKFINVAKQEKMPLAKVISRYITVKERQRGG